MSALDQLHRTLASLGPTPPPVLDAIEHLADRESIRASYCHQAVQALDMDGFTTFSQALVLTSTRLLILTWGETPAREADTHEPISDLERLVRPAGFGQHAPSTLTLRTTASPLSALANVQTSTTYDASTYELQGLEVLVLATTLNSARTDPHDCEDPSCESAHSSETTYVQDAVMLRAHTNTRGTNPAELRTFATALAAALA